MDTFDTPVDVPFVAPAVETPALPPVVQSLDEIKLTALRYLVLADLWPPELDELDEYEDFFPAIGWETARGCYADYDEARAKALTYINSDCWFQVVDLYTMSIICASYDGDGTVH